MRENAERFVVVLAVFVNVSTFNYGEYIKTK